MIYGFTETCHQPIKSQGREILKNYILSLSGSLRTLFGTDANLGQYPFQVYRECEEFENDCDLAFSLSDPRIHFPSIDSIESTITLNKTSSLFNQTSLDDTSWACIPCNVLCDVVDHPHWTLFRPIRGLIFVFYRPSFEPTLKLQMPHAFAQENHGSNPMTTTLWQQRQFPGSPSTTENIRDCFAQALKDQYASIMDHCSSSVNAWCPTPCSIEPASSPFFNERDTPLSALEWEPSFLGTQEMTQKDEIMLDATAATDFIRSPMPLSPVAIPQSLNSFNLDPVTASHLQFGGSSLVENLEKSLVGGLLPPLDHDFETCSLEQTAPGPRHQDLLTVEDIQVQIKTAPLKTSGRLQKCKPKITIKVPSVFRSRALSGLPTDGPCAFCGRDGHGQWRSGPEGSILCNPCGLRYRRSLQKAAQAKLKAGELST
jgi:hypothetical protein